jgi:hypothetical protein
MNTFFVIPIPQEKYKKKNMKEYDRKLLDKHAVAFQRDLDLTEVIPYMIEARVLRDVHQAELDVSYNESFIKMCSCYRLTGISTTSTIALCKS